MNNSLGHVTQTRVRPTKVGRAHCVYPLYVEKQANRSGSQKQQRNNRVNHLSLLFHSLTSHAGGSFGFSQHIALVACLSLQITPLYPQSTLRKEKKNAITHPSHTLKRIPPISPYPLHIQRWRDFSKAERDIILESSSLLGSQVFYK